MGQAIMRELPIANEPAGPAGAEGHEHRHWAERLAALGDMTNLPPRLQAFAAATRQHFQSLLRENSALARQVAALEGQLRETLASRVALAGRVAQLEDQLALLRREQAVEQEALDRLERELDRAQPTANGQRRPIPLRPPPEVPRVAPRQAAPALHADREGAAAPPLASSRQGQATVGDEELLLGADAAEPLLAPFADAGNHHWNLEAVVNGVASGLGAGSYALIAHPFARFSDLGQFQAAIQSLIGVHNVRVRRFAQGTLEMRVDYDGPAPLTEVLRGLPLAVDEVIQEESFRLRVRLAAANAG